MAASDSYRDYFLDRMKAYGLYNSEEMSMMDIRPEVLKNHPRPGRPLPHSAYSADG